MAILKKTLLGVLIMAISLGCAAKPPAERGIRDGRLLPCPQSPNCVSTMEDADRFITPLEYLGSRADAKMKVKAVLKKLGNTEIKKENDDYLWIECTTKVMRFVDDVEMYFPAKENKIHVRSASRIGYSDFGANRKRVEKIRKLFMGDQD